jgi:hypothetical protein
MPLFVRRELPVQAYRWTPNGPNQEHVERVEGYGVPIVETEKGVQPIYPGNWVVETYSGYVLVMPHEKFIVHFQLYVEGA